MRLPEEVECPDTIGLLIHTVPAQPEGEEAAALGTKVEMYDEKEASSSSVTRYYLKPNPDVNLMYALIIISPLPFHTTFAGHWSSGGSGRGAEGGGRRGVGSGGAGSCHRNGGG